LQNTTTKTPLTERPNLPSERKTIVFFLIYFSEEKKVSFFEVFSFLSVSSINKNQKCETEKTQCGENALPRTKSKSFLSELLCAQEFVSLNRKLD
jgi:penicillin-binding protein-related factor A (putative recombinase)